MPTLNKTESVINFIQLEIRKSRQQDLNEIIEWVKGQEEKIEKKCEKCEMLDSEAGAIYAFKKLIAHLTSLKNQI